MEIMAYLSWTNPAFCHDRKLASSHKFLAQARVWKFHANVSYPLLARASVSLLRCKVLAMLEQNQSLWLTCVHVLTDRCSWVSLLEAYLQLFCSWLALHPRCGFGLVHATSSSNSHSTRRARLLNDSVHRVYLCACVHACVHAHVRACVGVCVSLHIRVCLCVCFVCLCVCWCSCYAKARTIDCRLSMKEHVLTRALC